MIVKETRGEILEALNKLLTRSRDAEEGYKSAADSVKDVELKNLFLAQSRERAEFAQELDREIRALGSDPDDSTSVIADLHRAWIHIKSAFSSDDDKAVVNECRVGDGEALDEYKHILQETDLQASTRELLLQQKNKVESAHDSMARLALVV